MLPPPQIQPLCIYSEKAKEFVFVSSLFQICLAKILCQPPPCQCTQYLRNLDRGDKEFSYIVTSRSRKVVENEQVLNSSTSIWSQNSTKMHTLHNISKNCIDLPQINLAFPKHLR